MTEIDAHLEGIFQQNGTFSYDDSYEYKDECDPEDGMRWKPIFLLLLYVLSLVLGLLGNGLVFWIMAQRRRSWTLTDTFILHLGVADCLLLLTLPFRAAQTFQSQEWSFQQPLCKVTGAIFNINIYCGVLLLGGMNLMSSRKNSRVGHVTCACVWLFSTLLSVPDWLFLGVVTSQGRTKCGPIYPTDSWHLASRLLYHTAGFLLPSAVLLYYSCILLRLQRGSQGLQKHRAVRVILALVLVFFLCWTPYNITLMVDTFSVKPAEPSEGSCEQRRIETVVEVTAAVCCFRASFNPLLYFLVCGNFRKVVLQKLRRQRGTHNNRFLWDSSVIEQTAPQENGALNQSRFQHGQSTHC